MAETAEERLIIGRIGGPYGIRGWVKIRSFTEPIEGLLDYRNHHIKRKGVWGAVQFEEGRRHGKGLVARLRDVDSRNAAEAVAGCEVAVAAAELPPLREDEFYWHQLQGLEVRCGEELLGRVGHLLETGANDVLVVNPCSGSRDRRQRLIPWLRGGVVTRVNLTEACLDVDWDPEY
ncbi:MAG: ribosome maturation factor RimM [Halieaceae bacterium]|nr:ribosome maturation factor RimM [Halieaceae bacterium]